MIDIYQQSLDIHSRHKSTRQVHVYLKKQHKQNKVKQGMCEEHLCINIFFQQNARKDISC